MKMTFRAALAAALLLAGCSSSSKETKTASSDSTQNSSTAQTGRASAAELAADVPAGTAPGAPSAPPLEAPAVGGSSSVHGSAAERGADVAAGTGGNAPSSGGIESPAARSSASARGSPAERGADVAAGTGGTSSPYSRGITVGSGTAADASLRWANGRLARVDRNGRTITVERADDKRSITLTVDERTQIFDPNGSMASGLSSLQEGQQVRAAFDPASNHADRIEVMPKSPPSDRK
jgi:outer membrane murein-binding lipoprotein Lpp